MRRDEKDGKDGKDWKRRKKMSVRDDVIRSVIVEGNTAHSDF